MTDLENASQTSEHFQPFAVSWRNLEGRKPIVKKPAFLTSGENKMRGGNTISDGYRVPPNIRLNSSPPSRRH